VRAHVPGINLDQIEVNLNQGMLQIKGEKQVEENNEEQKFYRRAQNSFWYQVALPSQVDENDPKAVLENGVLKVTLNKIKQRQSKRINISQRDNSGNGSRSKKKSKG
jgi:HSP20 family protein